MLHFLRLRNFETFPSGQSDGIANILVLSLFILTVGFIRQKRGFQKLNHILRRGTSNSFKNVGF